MHRKYIARLYVGLADMCKCFYPTIADTTTFCTACPACTGHAEGSGFTAIGQDVGGHGFQKLYAPHAAFTAMPFACMVIPPKKSIM